MTEGGQRGCEFKKLHNSLFVFYLTWNSTIKNLLFSQESLVEAEANSLFDLMAYFDYIATFLLISLLKTPQFNFNTWKSTIKNLPFSQESLVEAEANSLFDLMASFDDGATYQGLLGLIHHLRAADIGPIFL